jgi:uncharacterized protein YpmB
MKESRIDKKDLIIGSVVILIIIVILSVFLFIKKSEKNSEELIFERGVGVGSIEGRKDFDERFMCVEYYSKVRLTG